MELGNPNALQNWVEIPQGVTMVQRAEDMIKSECLSVINRIEVQNLPQPERVLTYR